jgi:hypothetical protein
VQRTANTKAVFTIQGSITGRVSPADAADAVWVLNTKDSVRAGLVSGSFSAEVKPGRHKLLVDAKSPYRDVVLDNLEVKDKQVLDIGEIILQQ